MGPELDPNGVELHASAAFDEPRFELLASDPLAPFLVSILSSLRYGDVEAAAAKFEAMVAEAAPRYGPAPDLDQASEALDCAMAMFAWVSRKASASLYLGIADAADDWRARRASQVDAKDDRLEQGS